MHAYILEYLEDVKRASAESMAASTAARAERLKPLHVKIQEWWATLPETERDRPFTMNEFARQFKTSPGLIGNALHQLGWQRGRRWGKGSYRRYWLRPG